jgi:hypothetical protein
MKLRDADDLIKRLFATDETARADAVRELCIAISAARSRVISGAAFAAASSAPTTKVKNEKKLFTIARAIWIIEALIQNQSEREPVNDLALEYHSNEFFLCFDFFERLNWIKSVPLSQGVRRFKFTCEQQFVEKLLDKLGFERKEFIVY